MLDNLISLLEKDLTIKRATVFLSPKLTAKVTRQGKPDGRNRSATYVYTKGKPNYAEREFIRKCKLVGEPFPVKKALLKFYRG